MHALQSRFLIILFSALAATAFAKSTSTVSFESADFRYVISSEAKNVALIDRATGTNYLRTINSPCAIVRVKGKDQNATSATLDQDRLTLHFRKAGTTVTIKTETHPTFITFTVESVDGGEIDALTFLNVPLTLKGTPQEPFGACALSMNLFTRVDALPALNTDLRASCEKKFGIVGAKVTIVGEPMGKLLPALQNCLSQASELPVCKVAGPWAHEIPFNHGSYLFNFGSLTQTNVESWIDMAKSLGFTQIDNHGGGEFFRFGDMELNRKKWPDGWDSYQRIVDRLHAAGISSIFHSYAFFIDKRSKYVTPVPDARLDSFRSFTLAEPLAADTTEITVNESTEKMSTVTGFFEHNSIVLHIGDELVTFGGASKKAPWRFTGVKRGAFNTKASTHAAGAKARHLKECFGLFVPNVETSLFEEIAANHADVVNKCGFDGIYLDAIDGSSILRGDKENWYWADKFVVEIQKRLKKPVGMEMSSMGHHFWQYRTRWQAWDLPQRGHKRFIDLHAQGVNGGLLLPLHLGWWGFQSFNPPQIEPSYPDVMENLGAKLIGWDAGISLTAGVDRETLRNTPLFRRAAEILRTSEELRHAGTFDETTRAKLRESGKEFALGKDAAGKPRFHRVQSQSQTIAIAEPWTTSWRATNSFDEQPIKFRLEALTSASPPSETNSIVLADFSRANAQEWKRTSATGVTFSVSAAKKAGDGFSTLAATASKNVARKGAWARLEKRFEPTLNLKTNQALAIEIEGDGSGALLAIRLESPQHISYGAVADRYVTLDFTGRRSFTLVETESTRWSDYVWNDGKGLYNVYRETIDFGAVEKVSVWLQNLQPGRKTKCRIGAIRALPLRPAAVKNPKIMIAGKVIEFPVELAAGSWIECNGPDDCAIYGSKGESLGKVIPRGDWPAISAGSNALEFSCESGSDSKPRARVTIFNSGEEL